MASFSQIRRAVIQDIGVADKYMKYVAKGGDAANALLAYGESVDYVLKLPQELDMGNGLIIPVDPKRHLRAALLRDFRNNMESIFPRSTINWSDPLASATQAAGQILQRSEAGKKLYVAFIGRQIASWTHPHMSKQPLNFLPSKLINPDQVTAFRETAETTTAAEKTPKPRDIRTTPLRALVPAAVPAGAE